MGDGKVDTKRSGTSFVLLIIKIQKVQKRITKT